jgi:ABC-type lipopolysaccharide export system ATPase subunit
LVEVYVVVKSPSRFAMLDEPFTHLSPLQVEKVKELLLQEKQQKGFLVTDHMYHQVLDICDDLYVLSNGKTHLTKTEADIQALCYARF